MCGLVGAFHPGNMTVSLTVIASMRDAMTHRGPDSAGIWQSPNKDCAFGHRRLSIVDISASADQPMTNRDQTITIVYNGEIYNHAEIRRELVQLGVRDWQTDHSDTEVLLRAWEVWGVDCLERLRGMFAFALFDSRDSNNPVVHLVRDRMGKKPLYIAQTDDGEWIFASEIKALIQHPSITPEMDKNAFWHYLTFIVAPAPLTMFKGIFKIPSGHMVTIAADGKAHAAQYFDLIPSKADTLSENDLSFDEAADEFLRLMRQAVERRMVSDVPVGVLLSGGVDSSLITGLMAEQMDRPVSTYSVGYDGYDEYNEFSAAERIAKRYGTDHHKISLTPLDVSNVLDDIIFHQDEPIADNVCIPLWSISKAVHDSGTKVVQVGEGADEHFLGYWWCEHYRKKSMEVFEPARHCSKSFQFKRLIEKVPFLGTALAGEDVEITNRAQRGDELFWGGAAAFWGSLRDELTPSQSPFAENTNCPVHGLMGDQYSVLDSNGIVAAQLQSLGELASPEILQQISYLESRMRLPEHLLMRVDKMTMAHSVEARAPFLDDDVVRFASRLPLSYKLKDGVGKRIVKKVAEKFMDNDLIYQTKRGFGAPMDKWFADAAFGERCQELINDSALYNNELINSSMVDRMLSQQRAGYGGNGFHLWTVLNAVLWHLRYIEGAEGAFSSLSNADV